MKNLKKILAFALVMIMAFSFASIAVNAEDEVNESVEYVEAIELTPAQVTLIDPSVEADIKEAIDNINEDMSNIGSFFEKVQAWIQGIVDELKAWFNDFMEIINRL